MALFHSFSWLSNIHNFLSAVSDKVAFFYVNEVTFGKPLGNLRMEAGCQGNFQSLPYLPGPQNCVSPVWEDLVRSFTAMVQGQDC